MSISVLVHVRRDPMRLGGCECHTSFGVDFVSVGAAPGGECIWVDVCLDDDVSQLENFFPPFLGTLLPVLEGIGNVWASFEIARTRS